MDIGHRVTSTEGKEASQQVPCHVINYGPVTLMTEETQGAVTMGTFIFLLSGDAAPVSHCTLSSAASRLPDFCSPWQWMWAWECSLSIILSSWKAPWLQLMVVIRPDNRVSTLPLMCGFPKSGSNCHKTKSKDSIRKANHILYPQSQIFCSASSCHKHELYFEERCEWKLMGPIFSCELHKQQ